MLVKPVRRIIDALVALCALAGVLAVGTATIALAKGTFGIVRWPVQWDTPVASSALADGGMLTASRGEIVLAGAPFAHAIDVIAQLAVIGLAAAALLALRKVLILLAAGTPFTVQTLAAIRRIGFAILGICAVSLVHVVIVTQIILRSAPMPRGVALHTPLSWNVEGMRNVWMEYDVPLIALVVALLAFLVAEAFRVGLAYREDSESMV
ncbi:MAG: hypothetical protein ACKO01_10000 [Erythrobacter sp.]